MDLQVRHPLTYEHACSSHATAQLNTVCVPLSCVLRRNIWANKAALILFNKSPQEFLGLQYGSPVFGTVSKDDVATFIALNDLVHQEVEVWNDNGSILLVQSALKPKYGSKTHSGPDDGDVFCVARKAINM